MIHYPKLIRQKTPTTCGQCCIAMLTGFSIDYVINHMFGHSDISSDEDIKRTTYAKERGCEFIEGTPPQGIIAIQKHKDPNSTLEHWTLWWKDKTLDPANIKSGLWPVYKYLIID